MVIFLAGACKSSLFQLSYDWMKSRKELDLIDKYIGMDPTKALACPSGELPPTKITWTHTLTGNQIGKSQYLVINGEIVPVYEKRANHPAK